MMDETCPYLFVYGTLRRDAQSEASRLLFKDAEFVGPAKVPGRLYDLGEYPGMTEAEETTEWVKGELYRLKHPDRTLAILDEYEGCGKGGSMQEFERSLAEATLDDEITQTTWVYLYRLPVPEHRRILSGDYLARPRL